MFIRTKDGRYVSLSSVEQMWSVANSKSTQDDFARLSDGEQVQLDYNGLQSTIESVEPTVAANEGFYVVEEITEEDGSLSSALVPVLAWLISRERGVLPVTIEGVNHDGNHVQPILYPDGRVTKAMTATWDSLEDYTKDLNTSV